MRTERLLLLAFAVLFGMYVVDRAIYIREARERKAQSEKWGQRVDQGLDMARDLFEHRK